MKAFINKQKGLYPTNNDALMGMLSIIDGL